VKRMCYILLLALLNCVQISNAHESWDKQSPEKELLIYRLKELKEDLSWLRGMSDCIQYHGSIKYITIAQNKFCDRHDSMRTSYYTVRIGSDEMWLGKFLAFWETEEFPRPNSERLGRHYESLKPRFSELLEDISRFREKEHKSQKEFAELDSRYHQLHNDFHMPLYEAYLFPPSHKYRKWK